MNKCSEFVYDTLTRRQRKCKKKFNFVIQNCKYCHLHAKINYKKYICKIQAVFRGYKLRRMLEYFKSMPCDIQSKIIGIIKDEHRLVKYNQRLSNFLLKKLVKEISEITNNYYNKTQFQLRRTILINALFMKTFKLIVLYKKYKKIIHLNPQFNNIICFDFNGTYNLSYFINLLLVSLIDIMKKEDEYFKQTFMDTGIDFSEILD